MEVSMCTSIGVSEAPPEPVDPSQQLMLTIQFMIYSMISLMMTNLAVSISDMFGGE